MLCSVYSATSSTLLSRRVPLRHDTACHLPPSGRRLDVLHLKQHLPGNPGAQIGSYLISPTASEFEDLRFRLHTSLLTASRGPCRSLSIYGDVYYALTLPCCIPFTGYVRAVMLEQTYIRTGRLLWKYMPSQTHAESRSTDVMIQPTKSQSSP
jgi:hypothetical protein